MLLDVQVLVVVVVVVVSMACITISQSATPGQKWMSLMLPSMLSSLSRAPRLRV